MGVSSWTFVFLAVTAVVLSLFGFEVFKTKPRYKLVIGILSRRENFEERNALRSTWLSDLTDNDARFPEIAYSFVVTGKDCEIPLEYRLSEYSCEERSSWENDQDLEDLHFWKRGHGCAALPYKPEYTSVGIDFVVISDVIVAGFALPVSSPNGTLVQLWDLANDVLVIQSHIDTRKDDGCWHTQDIDLYMLPEGFVGSLIITCGNATACVGIKSWQDKIGYSPVVAFSPVMRFVSDTGEHVLPVHSDDLLLPALMVIRIASVSSVKQHHKMKESAFMERRMELRELSEKLKLEMETHGDIIAVNDVDGRTMVETYRNLPRKLVSFHHWCANNVDADYVMKTDDDSYVDVEKVLQALMDIENGPSLSHHTWVGHFRREWNVDRWGKWAEHQYSSPTYPDHACGAGNVVSAGLSSWLSDNRENLRYYQGEDISAGIWFAALDVQYIHASNWLCGDECDSDMVVSAQHSPSDLRGMWQNRKKCGNPCKLEATTL